jgi:23S rRNA-intervening sequence protein
MHIVAKGISKRAMVTAISGIACGIISQAKARGSLSETQYFIHLGRRLRYLSDEDADTLHEQTKFVFACLHGLIRSVEKEAGKVSKVIATATSLLAIAFLRWSSGQ